MRNPSSDRHDAGRQDAARTFVRLAADSTQQIATALQASRPLVGAWTELLGAAAVIPLTTLSSACRSMSSAMSGDDCYCETPETECPPYCVCDIAWEGTRGEHVKATIGLTNTRKVPQVFTLTATTFQGPNGDTGAAAAVVPAAVPLQAGESTTVTVSFTVPETFTVGDTHDGQVLITGLYEQCLRLRLRVRPVPHCDVQQGEIPTRIRAHRWYEHFQCEELCFEPARVPGTPGTVPGTTVRHQPSHR